MSQTMKDRAILTFSLSLSLSLSLYIYICVWNNTRTHKGFEKFQRYQKGLLYGRYTVAEQNTMNQMLQLCLKTQIHLHLQKGQ